MYYIVLLLNYIKINNNIVSINIFTVLKYYDTILVLKINTNSILYRIKILVYNIVYYIALLPIIPKYQMPHNTTKITDDPD